MGLFRRNKIQPVNDDIPAKKSIPSSAQKGSTDFVQKQTAIGLEFYFPNNDVDMTQLIIKNRDMNFPDRNVYDCLVSWYQRCINENQTVLRDPVTGIIYEMSSPFHSESVLAEIDIHLLQTDPVYKRAVMKSLLDESRVSRYLDAGMKTPEEIDKAKAEGHTSIDLCGRYIGGIMKDKNGYTKFFNPSVGRRAHNLPDMVQKRQKAKADKENARNSEIAKRKSEIDEYRQRIAQNEARLKELEER